MKKYIHSILIIFCCVQFSWAQIISDVSISKDSIGIGESIELYYSLTIPNPQSIQHIDFAIYDSLASIVPNQADSLPPYYAEVDWISPFSEDQYKKLKLSPNQFQQTPQGLAYRDTFQGTFWDVGVFPILHPVVVLDSSVNQKIMRMQSPRLMVMPPNNMVNPDTTQAILPIKNILKEDKTIADFLWILYVLGTILLIGGLLYYFLRPKTPEPVTTKTITIIPSHTMALDKLKVLDQKGLWQQGEIKAFQTELTFIIREYLERRFKINALESTTDQINRALKSKNLTQAQVNNLGEILQIADLVKFAKAKPDSEIHSEFLHKAKYFVNETTNPEEVQREETIQINSETDDKI